MGGGVELPSPMAPLGLVFPFRQIAASSHGKNARRLAGNRQIKPALDHCTSCGCLQRLRVHLQLRTVRLGKPLVVAHSARVSLVVNNNPAKAHFIADQDWFAMLDAIDDAVEKSGPSTRDKEVACKSVRSMLVKIGRSAYRCRSCGRLHITDLDYALRTYEPEDPFAGQSLFKSKNGDET